MNDLLSSPIHVLCIAGPDAGVAFAARGEAISIGREGDVQVQDRFTSRVHLLATGVSSRRGVGVHLEQLSASNTLATGRLISPLPGFARTWAWLRTPRAYQRSRREYKEASGATTGSHSPSRMSRFVRVGGVFQVGANLWEVRARPAAMSLKTALETQSSTTANRRMLYFLLPLVSLLWLLGRFAGWAWALAVFGFALAVAFYVWRAWRSHRAPLPRWGILFGLCLPARGAGGRGDRFGAGTPAGDDRRGSFTSSPAHSSPRYGLAGTPGSGASSRSVAGRASPGGAGTRAGVFGTRAGSPGLVADSPGASDPPGLVSAAPGTQVGVPGLLAATSGTRLKAPGRNAKTHGLLNATPCGRPVPLQRPTSSTSMSARAGTEAFTPLASPGPRAVRTPSPTSYGAATSKAALTAASSHRTASRNSNSAPARPSARASCGPTGTRAGSSPPAASSLPTGSSPPTGPSSLTGSSLPTGSSTLAATSHRPTDWSLDLSEAPSWRRVLRLPGRTLVRIRFRQGPQITVQAGETIALNGDESWGAWALAQAVVCARADGINAIIAEDERDVLLSSDGSRLLTVLAGASAGFEADHRIECGSNLPLQVALPTEAESVEAGTPSRVLVDELPIPSEGAGLAVAVGVRESEPVLLDLVRDGPHALVAGTTGSGKSEALRTWLLQMCRLRGPGHLRLVLIDYKGGAAFRDLAQLPHAEGLLTDLRPQETSRAVAGLAAELQAREEALAARGFASVDEWESHSSHDAPARIICVIDEFRAMIRTHPDTLDDLVDLAARGRSLGMHLIAATQSPGGVVTPAMRANLTLRICLRTACAADSFEMLGSDAASILPRIPGRAILDAGEPVEIQWAQWTKPVPEVFDAGAVQSIDEGVLASSHGFVPADFVPEALSSGGFDDSVGRGGAQVRSPACSLNDAAPGETGASIALPTVQRGQVRANLQLATGGDDSQQSAAVREGSRGNLHGYTMAAGVCGTMTGASAHCGSVDDDMAGSVYGCLDRPRLWMPALPEELDFQENEYLLKHFECEGEPFGWLDKIPERTYAPLVLDNSKVAVVGNYGPALESIASATNAVRVDPAQGAVDAVHLLEMAKLAGRAIVIEDLGALLRAVDEWGAGLGHEWWRSWSARAGAIAVGVSVADYALVRAWPRTLLAVTAVQARSLGLSREIAASLMAFPWDEEESVSVSLIAPRTVSAPGRVEPVCSASPIIREVRRRAGELKLSSLGQMPEDGNAVWLVGDVPVLLQEQLVGEARDENLRVEQISEAELAASGYRPARGDISVLGSVSRHALRGAGLPAFVGADLAENGGTWVGICEAWYRIKFKEN